MMKRERHVMGVRKSRRLIEAAQKLKFGGEDLMMRLPSELLMNILLRLPAGDIMRCKCVCKEFLYKLNLLTRLPSELLMDILLRLDVRDIMRCKCVCKELQDLVMNPVFINSHLSRAVPGLVVYDWTTQKKKPYKFVEFVKNLDPNRDECRCRVVRNFNLPFHELKPVPPVHSSANGLLFMYKRDRTDTEYIISVCNPITGEYIKLPRPKMSKASSDVKETCGFGVSRISGQYKVVWMQIEKNINTTNYIWEHECQVYTVGTGSWRRVASSSLVSCEEDVIGGAALNGNIHWMAWDLKREAAWISGFDLETELFTTFSTPPIHHSIQRRNLSVLGNCLCLCDNWLDDEGGYEIDIWLMKEYGDHKSWTKELVIRKVHIDFLGRRIRPIKVFEDGDILIESRALLYYSNKTKTIRNINCAFGLDCNAVVRAVIYTPSFVSLKTFAMENVISF